MDEETTEERIGWEQPSESLVTIETGRGNSVQVPVGSPFEATIRNIASNANYGGAYRVFLNAEEIVNPSEAPATIEQGMRIILTTYDKVG